MDKGFRMISSHVCVKKPFGAGTRQCMALLALALVCSFYQLQLGRFIIWNIKALAFKAHQL